MKFDVLVLFHLCGDLMQPLHVGYGSDKGGNTYQVNYNGEGTNLHSIWDSRIIDVEGITMATLKKAGAPDTKLKIKPVDFMVYLTQSRGLLAEVYHFEGHKLDDDYMHKEKSTVASELWTAGTLLATCLENVFSRMSNVPAGPATAPSASQKPATAGKPITTAGTITPDQAAAHIGEQVTVCGKVYGTRALNNGPTFLNMGAEYPDNPFTAVIMFDKRSSFSYKPEEYLKGKTICVTGMVKNYKGKPEIVVNGEKQVKIQ